MENIILIVHFVVCAILVVVILLQAGKGADMGAVFGGGSGTVFGNRGAATFLGKLTTGLAIAFMMTSLSLAYYKMTPKASVTETANQTAGETSKATGSEEATGQAQPDQPKPEAATPGASEEGAKTEEVAPAEAADTNSDAAEMGAEATGETNSP